MDTVKMTKILGVTILVSGLVLILVGTQIPNPDTTVTHIGEFNESYADSQTPNPAFGSYTGPNTTAEDIHTVYNVTELDDSTRDVIEEAEANGTATAGTLGGIEEGRFIVRFEDGTEMIYTSVPNGVTPAQILLVGVVAVLIGILTLSSMRSGEQLPTSIERASPDSQWKFDVVDE